MKQDTEEKADEQSAIAAGASLKKEIKEVDNLNQVEAPLPSDNRVPTEKSEVSLTAKLEAEEQQKKDEKKK